jgi:tetratricopeptide (TPR) repeat protein
MKRILLGLTLTAALTLSAVAPASADPVDDRVAALQRNWDHANYEVPASGRLAAMTRLNDEADALVAAAPGRAGPLIWSGIITASEAGLRGGLSGLGLAREARTLLERAEAIDPRALNAAALTSLGSLYAQVPGAPIGFGNRTRARSYLQRALAIAPDDIDANYFMGDLLNREHDYAGAVRVLEHALACPARPGRAAADRGRRAEVTALLAEARSHTRSRG